MRNRLIFYAILAILGAPLAGRQAQVAASPQADDLAAAPRVSQAEFKKALVAGTILVLDVRDGASYANGHIPGAVSIPLDEVATHAKDLKTGKRPIVTYCA